VIALEIVEGRGEMFSTAAREAAFFRTHGPDLCGLFLGDCGALGVKARATLKVFRRPTHVAACSFSFKRFEDFSAAMGAVSSRALCSEILGLDPDIQKGFLGTLTTKSAMDAARAIWSTAPGPIEAAGALMRAGLAARDFMKGEDFVVYFTAEGWSKAEVAAKITSVRALVGASGVEVSNAGALALRGNPFMPLAPVAPMSGNRWMPTHGVFSVANFLNFHHAFEAWKAKHAAAIAKHKLTMTRMFVPVGAQAIIYEPTFYWPDSRTPAQQRLAPSEYLARVKALPDNPETRAFVFGLRRELTDLMAAHGAQHFQLGRWYRYFSLLSPGQRALVESLKRTLDPHGLMNPDALELPAS
jgi:D-lactate dehydrogenase (cytochrome)